MNRWLVVMKNNCIVKKKYERSVFPGLHATMMNGGDIYVKFVNPSSMNENITTQNSENWYRA